MFDLWERGAEPSDLLKLGNFLTSSVTCTEDAVPDTLLIYVLFNDALCSSDYIVLIGRMISKQSIGKDTEKKGHDLIWSTISAFVKRYYLSWKSRVFLSRFEQGHPEYKTGAPSLERTCSLVPWSLLCAWCKPPLLTTCGFAMDSTSQCIEPHYVSYFICSSFSKCMRYLEPGYRIVITTRMLLQ